MISFVYTLILIGIVIITLYLINLIKNNYEDRNTKD
jgi:hypothetical protein